ncbi:helix-turn-helix domain-containing protein [Candidatus Nitrospira bockiana]
MEDQGLDPAGLGTKLGVTANTVYRYLKGSVYPSADVLVKLCEIGGLDIADVLSQLTKERQAARRKPYAPDRGESSSFIAEAGSFRKEVRPLLELLDKLNAEQLTAVRQCAEALVGGDPDVERHLIAQLKLLNRMLSPRPTRRGARSR